MSLTRLSEDHPSPGVEMALALIEAVQDFLTQQKRAIECRKS